MKKLVIFLCSLGLILGMTSCSKRIIIVDKTKPVSAPKNYGRVVASQNHLKNGKKFLNRGNYAKAMHEFNKAIEADPNNWEAHYYRGITYQKWHRYRESVPEFKMAIELNKNDDIWVSRVRVSLGYSYELKGDLVEADGEYKIAVGLDPKNKAAFKAQQRIKDKLKRSQKEYKKKQKERKYGEQSD